MLILNTTASNQLFTFTFFFFLRVTNILWLNVIIFEIKFLKACIFKIYLMIKVFETIQNSNIFIHVFQSKLSFYKNAVKKIHIKKKKWFRFRWTEIWNMNDLTKQGFIVMLAPSKDSNRYLVELEISVCVWLNIWHVKPFSFLWMALSPILGGEGSLLNVSAHLFGIVHKSCLKRGSVSFFLIKFKCVLTYIMKQNLVTIIKLRNVAARYINNNACIIIFKH